MPAKHVPWSEAERTTLRQMWADGAEPVEIGRRLGRSKHSVRRQTKTLKLPAQRPEPDMAPPPEPRTHAPNRCREVRAHCRRCRARRQSIRRRPRPFGSLHRPQRQRLPARDGPGALPCLRVVGDAREQPPQLERSREFAPLLIDGADRSLVLLGDDEHRWSMGRHDAAGNYQPKRLRTGLLYFATRYASIMPCCGGLPMPRRRSQRLQRYIDLGELDEEDATEMDAVFLQEAEEDEGNSASERSRPTLIWPPPAVENTTTAEAGTSTQTIINTDCLEHMRSMPAHSVDCIVTSPPYNLGKAYGLHNDRMDDAGYLDWQSNVAAEIFRLLRPKGHLFLNVGWNSEHPERSVEVFLRYREHLQLQNRITWVKSIAVDSSSLPPPLRAALHERQVGHFVSLNSAKYLSPTTEDIWHLTPSGDSPIDPDAEGVGVGYVWADQPERFGHHRERHCRGNAWHIPYPTVRSAAERDHHPATFPVALPLMCLRLAGLSPGAMVLDPVRRHGYHSAGGAAAGLQRCRAGDRSGVLPGSTASAGRAVTLMRRAV